MRNLKLIAAVLGIAMPLTLMSPLPLKAGQRLTQTPRPAAAASVQPKVRGTIKDPSGAVMPGVDVSLLQGATVAKAAKTDSTGNFSFDLPAGAYQLAVTAPDFVVYTQPVRVVANMPALVVTMSVDGITSVVTVTDRVDEPVVDASLSLDATTITGAKIDDLPDDEESLLAYLQSLAGGEGNAQLIIDGFEGGRMPTRDQIAQIIIEPNSFNANGTGPRITIISKQAGPTKWAGNMSYRYQDSAINSRTPGIVNKPVNRRSQVDVSSNGPVVKGKLGMTINFSKIQSDSGDNYIKAITPSGPVNRAYTSPATTDSIGFSQNFYLSKKHTLSDNFNYNRSKNSNVGIGGFTLEERASDNRNHNWNFQFTDNLTISSKMTNTLGFRMNRGDNANTPRTFGVAINVADAFYGGGSPNQNESRNSNYNLNETLRWTPSTKWNIQFALNANHQSSYSNSRNNYQGTFFFSSLQDYEDGTPLTFTQTVGNPVAQTEQTDANTSVQVTYRIKETMSLSMGAQYTIQTHLKDYNNVSPTLQLQTQVRKRTIISVGARLSYPNTGFSMGSYEQLLRGNGSTNQVSTNISNPTYPDPFINGDVGTTFGLTSVRQARAADFVSPYAINSQLSVTHTFKKNWRVNTSFNATRQVHQMRNRNINAPYPGTPLDPFLTSDEIDLLHPFYPLVGRINQYESVGNSLQKNLNIQVQIPTTKKYLKTQIGGTFQYGLTWAADDNQAQNPYDVRSDWARNDQRQRFQGTFSIRPPHFGTYNFQISGNSGRTYSITTGRDANLDLNVNDRPEGVKRNSQIGPGYFNVNLIYTSPVLSLRKKKPEPKPVAGSAAIANPAAPSPLEQLAQSAQAAGLPPAAIQQLLAQAAAQPGLLNLGALNAPTSSTTKPPSLLHPQSTLNVRVANLLNNAQSVGYSGVISSPFFGQSTGYQPGRSFILTLNTRF